MKNYLMYVLGALMALCLLSMMTNSIFITSEPQRDAYIKNEEGKLVKVRLRTTASLNDSKVQTWIEKVIATCFTLTPENARGKARYCATEYFNSTSASAYYYRYAIPVADQIELSIATQYVALKDKMFIVHRPTPQKFYYRLRGALTISRVSKSETIPSARSFEVFIKPTMLSKNIYQYEIVGINI